jgi:hypothetical protein
LGKNSQVRIRQHHPDSNDRTPDIGWLDTSNEQHLSLTSALPANNQPFELHRFSWETDNAASTTVLSGTTFGARLHKNA